VDHRQVRGTTRLHLSTLLLHAASEPRKRVVGGVSCKEL
jgi:hypothetical protein